jgi:nicotinamidase-related amidase
MQSDSTTRSPLLLNRDDTLLMVVDMQQRLLGALPAASRIVWNTSRLVRGAKLLGVEVVATEQVPDKLGPTLPELAQHLGDIPSKHRFSCWECHDRLAEQLAAGRRKVLLAGIETHVCVLQTALDMLAAGFAVYVAVDAVGSRFDIDRDVALRRMESSGVTLTTTEATLMEWCTTAADAKFREISGLLKESISA